MMTFTALCHIDYLQLANFVEYWIDQISYWEDWNKRYNPVPERVEFCRNQVSELTGY